jgi:hypothetical protein
MTKKIINDEPGEQIEEKEPEEPKVCPICEGRKVIRGGRFPCPCQKK